VQISSVFQPLRFPLSPGRFNLDFVEFCFQVPTACPLSSVNSLQTRSSGYEYVFPDYEREI
jgi:hypothetical protein